ncbi:Double-stranded RNA-binding [Artemisia annua]|uniref:protein-serine/threonine phosphatase n=1 Tax=Artemisia annua TaxID=35608 RepID=A0A2U1LXU9_ARTAN|nr:Double-stranded RNA-binding [Artemisia annua]
MFKSVVVLYEGEKMLGNVDVSFTPENFRVLRHKISGKVVVSHLSKPSERCSPLAVLHTITSSGNGRRNGVCLKMECRDTSNHWMHFLYTKCLQQNKTAVVSLEDEELHLVPMRSKESSLYSYFWGFIVAPGLYESCRVMLNLRCLGIVVDLDETLIFANTLRSFEDRIQALKQKISSEVDPQRVVGMRTVVKRYEDDRNILKQYAETDQVVENGKVIKAQPEVIPPLTENHQPLVRPLIRLKDKNIILTRINPSVCDTSVLVSLRPGWNELRSYLTGGRRKRFEVYVCTMGEREYALEMWRLLDPCSYMIKSKELLNRIVCVKPGLKKSLSDVFHDGDGHPKMTLVIDDRMKVWDEKDQHRVHAVSSFAPYYASQAEVNNDVPILCVARDVACNVRGGFFKDFDNRFSQKIAEVAHEDDIKDIIPPDVSYYLTLENSNEKFTVAPENDIKDISSSDDAAAALTGNRDPTVFNGMTDAELVKGSQQAIEPRLKTLSQQNPTPKLPEETPNLQNLTEVNLPETTAPISVPSVPPKISKPIVQYTRRKSSKETPILQHVTQVNLPETTTQQIPASRRRDPRLKIPSQQNPAPISVPFVQPTIPKPTVQYTLKQLPEETRKLQHDAEVNLPETTAPISVPFLPEETRILQHVTQVNLPEISLHSSPEREEGELPESDSDDMLRRLLVLQHEGDEDLLEKLPSSKRDRGIQDDGRDAYDESPAEYLHKIAVKCGTEVEFRTSLVPSTELVFSTEVRFAEEKIGEGIGKTRREAHHQAALESLMNLAENYMSVHESGTTCAHGDGNSVNESDEGIYSDGRPSSPESEPARDLNSRKEGRNKGPTKALIELCMKKGLHLRFQQRPHRWSSTDVYAEVEKKVKIGASHAACILEVAEVDGEVMGKGRGPTWDEAKMKAAYWAINKMTSNTRKHPQKRRSSFRSYHRCKHWRESRRLRKRVPSSADD